jgi:flagellar motility protein MotE (MotC chaperone)
VSYDQRWDAIAEQWLLDCEFSEQVAKKYTPRLAQILQDMAEQEASEIADDLRQADDPANDPSLP